MFVIIPFVGNQTEFYLKLMFKYILKYLSQFFDLVIGFEIKEIKNICFQAKY